MSMGGLCIGPIGIENKGVRGVYRNKMSRGEVYMGIECQCVRGVYRNRMSMCERCI